MSRRKRVTLTELLRWIEGDWVDLWQLAVVAGQLRGVPPSEVQEFVLASIEPGLRAGKLRMGHVLRAPPHVGFHPLPGSVDDHLDILREALGKDPDDWVGLDIWFDAASSPDESGMDRSPGPAPQNHPQISRTS